MIETPGVKTPWSRCAPERTLEQWRNLLHSFGDRMDTAGLTCADLRTYLSESCLVKTDRVSMAHGLEVRVPIFGNPKRTRRAASRLHLRRITTLARWTPTERLTALI